MARGVLDRSGWLALALVCAAVLALARGLVPDPSGLGTHTQLGLPPCGFLALFSLPCPACGLTTSFAHTARLALLPALRAHPLGPLLFALLLALLARALLGVARGGSAAALLAHPRAGWGALALVLALLLVWVLRLCTGA